jgi:cysteine desulfurase
MMPFWTEHFGNPASVTHAYGWAAEAAVKGARAAIAAAIGATPAEVIFTSGATEANNLAIKGVAEAYFAQGSSYRHGANGASGGAGPLPLPGGVGV